MRKIGGVAQLGERLPCTQEVIGSNPFTSTRSLKRWGGGYSDQTEPPAFSSGGGHRFEPVNPPCYLPSSYQFIKLPTSSNAKSSDGWQFDDTR